MFMDFENLRALLKITCITKKRIKCVLYFFQTTHFNLIGLVSEQHGS
jgi:hypothetical protein